MAMKAMVLPLGLAVGVLAAEGTRRAVQRKNVLTAKALEENIKPKTNCSLEGTWYNQLGSEVIFNPVGNDGVLTGEYRTAVETKPGAAGKCASKLVGQTSIKGEHDTFGMTVMWKNGTSATSWTGQCHDCDGKKTLLTTWILKSEVDTPKDNWGSYRVGQDTFHMVPVRDGPRRHKDTHTPRDFGRQNQQEENEEHRDH